MGFKLVETSVLKVCKTPIQSLAGLADHYFLSETGKSLRKFPRLGEPKGLEHTMAIKTPLR